MGIWRWSVLMMAATPGLAHAAADPAWNGSWVLDRSQKEPDGAAADYRFTVNADGTVIWEIPSLKERNVLTLGGPAAPVHRPGAPAGMTLRLWAEAPRVWHYEVASPGGHGGAGRMTLSPDAKSWTDVPLDTKTGAEDDDLTMTYVKH